jgi:hypothetical protein
MRTGPVVHIHGRVRIPNQEPEPLCLIVELHEQAPHGGRCQLTLTGE